MKWIDISNARQSAFMLFSDKHKMTYHDHRHSVQTQNDTQVA